MAVRERSWRAGRTDKERGSDVSIRFEANIASDLSHFLTAEVEGWDEERESTEWIIYLLGVEMDRVFSRKENANAVLTEGNYWAKAERVVKRMWEETP